MSGDFIDQAEELERALHGRSDSPVEPGIAAFVEDVRTAFPKRPSSAEEQHLEMLASAAQLLAEKGDPAARPASNADGRAEHVRLPKRRRVAVKVPAFHSLAAKLVVGSIVAVVSFGGLAVAGALPGSVQHGVATVAKGVGIGLPDPDEQEAEGDQGDENDQDELVADDQGDVNDQGESLSDDQGDQDDQGEQVSGDEGDQADENQGDEDDQGDSVSGDQGDENDQGDSVSGDQGNQDDQGDNGQ